MRKLVVTIVLASVAALALAACGSSSSSSSSTPSTSSAPAGGGGGGGAGGGGGGTASGGGSSVKIAADPSGALKYTTSSASATAGNVKVDFTNQSPVGHDVTIADSSGKVLGQTSIITGSNTSTSVNLKPGSYTFYCSVDSHEQAGMKGTLTVK
jgi:plastocyanin